MSTIVDTPSLPAHHIDDALLEREFGFADDFSLLVHDRWLAQLATSIQLGGSPPLQQRLRRAFVERLGPYHAWHDKHAPFPVVAPGLLDTGPITIAKQVNGAPVKLSFGTHLLTAGPTGTGKSTLLRHAIDQVYEQRLAHVIDLDLKNDRATTLAHEHVLDFDHLEFSPIAIPADADRTACLQNILHVLLEVLWGAELQRSAFAPALETLWQRTSNPSLADWQEEIRKQKSDTARGAANRLDALRIAHPKLFHSRANLWPLLHDSSLYVGVRGPLTPATRLIYWWIIYERWRYLTSRGNRAPHTLVVLDEGDVTLRRLQTPTGAPTLAVHALLRMREAGITFWVGTPTWDLDASALANFGAQLILRPNGRELLDLQRHLQLTSVQTRFLATMPQGTLIGKFNNAPHAFIATFENDPRNKTPTPGILEDARRRTTAAAAKYLAIEPTPISRSSTSLNTDTAAAREGKESWPPPSQAPTATASREQPTRATDSTPANAPASSAQVTSAEPSYNATSANARQEEIPPNALVEDLGIASNRSEKATSPNALRPRVALNPHATALLQDVGDHPFTLCTKAYRRCGLLLAQGDRARAQLERLTLLCATRVTCGRGRGKTGISLNLTAAGWKGRTPVKGLRGGSSVQHSFCVFELSRRIPGSTIEEYLGAKPVDLCIPFNTELHERFYRAITLLTGKAPHLEDGDIIALEVEISAPSRSSVRNAEKDAAAGVALSVLAVADRQPERLAHILPPNAIVLDVYTLLDTLRTTEDR